MRMCVCVCVCVGFSTGIPTGLREVCLGIRRLSEPWSTVAKAAYGVRRGGPNLLGFFAACRNYNWTTELGGEVVYKQFKRGPKAWDFA